MRKFITVLLMITMMALSPNSSFATRSGGSGEGAKKGGNDANPALALALARPAFFVTIALVQIVILTTLFRPRVDVGSPRMSVLTVLALTSTLTLAYFLYVLSELSRYFIYMFLFQNPYFQAVSRLGTDKIVTEKVDWEIADSEPIPEIAVSAGKRKAEPSVSVLSSPENQKSEKQKQIDEAVEAALRDPEVAERYLKFATPEVREAINNALDDQDEGKSGSSISYRLKSPGNFSALYAN